MEDQDTPILEESFLETGDQTIKLIAEFMRTRSKVGVEKDVDKVVDKLRDDDHIIESVRMDEGVTPFAVIELPMTNVRFNTVVEIHSYLVDLRGFEELTISTVDVGGITRLSQKR